MSESVKELVDANFLELEDSNSDLIASVACTHEGLWIQFSASVSFHLTPDAFDEYACSPSIENHPTGILYKKLSQVLNAAVLDDSVYVYVRERHSEIELIAPDAKRRALYYLENYVAAPGSV